MYSRLNNKDKQPLLIRTNANFGIITMQSKHYSSSFVYLATYAGTALVGGFLALIFSTFGFNGPWLLALAAFIAFRCASLIRKIIASILKSVDGVSGQMLTASTLSVRTLIGAIASICAGHAVVQIPIFTDPFGLGALASILVVMVLSIIFTIMATRS